MRAKGILTAVLATGVLLLASGFDGARADQNHRDGPGHEQAYRGQGHGYGWMGQRYFGDKRSGGYAYGQRARTHSGYGLNQKDRRTLTQVRHRFANDRAFHHYLRQHKPGLYARYMAHSQPRPQMYGYQHPQHYVWR
jgi:hypothetical protein